MPLSCDCFPGCWAKHSENWPSITYATEARHNEVRAKIIQNHLLPSGAYVSIDDFTLRVETHEYRMLVLEACGLHFFEPPKNVSAWHPTTDKGELRVLGKALEETGELSQVMARCIIQGLDEKEPRTGKLNRDWLEEEIADVQASILIMTQEFGLDTVHIRRRVYAKMEKLRKWRELIE